MLDGEIQNAAAGIGWLSTGVGLALWLGVRHRRTNRQLRSGLNDDDTANAIRMRLVLECFAAGGAFLVIFLLLDLLS